MAKSRREVLKKRSRAVRLRDASVAGSDSFILRVLRSARRARTFSLVGARTQSMRRKTSIGRMTLSYSLGL